MTDDQWSRVKPLINIDHNRKRRNDPRDVVDAIIYLRETGARWRELPASYPPWQTVVYYLAKFGGDEFLYRLDEALAAEVAK